MRSLGGVATFGKLNSVLDFTSWKTKTPEASVRRIVQENPAFFRIEPGLWALEELREKVLEGFDIKASNSEEGSPFTYTYYQGLAVEIGNLRKFSTYVPNQDKNKKFIHTSLREVASLESIYHFTYDEILKFARTVDVIWFNNRNMPSDFFEIEHSTDMKNSLSKFYELQDFNANFYIIAPAYREDNFRETLRRSIFESIKNRVKFVSYDSISASHSQEYRWSQTKVI